jgi:hypothetical protein
VDADGWTISAHYVTPNALTSKKKETIFLEEYAKENKLHLKLEE